MTRAALMLLAYLTAVPVFAEVADSSANGFTVKISMTVQGTPDEVYRKFLQVGDWWESAHTFSGNAHNLSIDDKPMGCFCEKLAKSGAVRHMEVLFVAPGQAIVMTGGLGPLQSMGVAGSLRIQMSKAESGTRLDVSYAVGGYAQGGLNQMAAPVEGVLTQQFARLKNLVERGDPAAK